MEKTARKNKFNIIDLLLIAVIIAATVLLVLTVKGRRGEEASVSKNATITYELRLEKISDRLRDSVNPGDTVYYGQDKKAIGQVVSVEYHDSVYTYGNSGGQLETAAYPGGYVDAVIKINAKANAGESGGYEVNGCAVKLGSIITFSTPNFFGEGECVEINEESSNDVE